MAQSDSRLKKIALGLISPLAVGILISVFLSVLAFYYYYEQENIKGTSGLLGIIYDFDQKSIDYRLNFRGARPADENVAVLAVDDRSIDIVGRWPWPRDVMGRALDNAFKNGAKVIATDIVWSEPSDRPEKKLVDSLQRENLLPANVQHQIEQTLSENDPDLRFRDYIEKNQEKLVMGNFYQNILKWQDKVSSMREPSGFQNSCYDIIFSMSPLQAIIERQKIPIVAIDSLEVILPDEFREIYSHKLSTIREDYLALHPREKTSFHLYQIEKDVIAQQELFCHKHFLDPAHDEMAKNIQSNWSSLQDSMTGLEQSSFEEWLLAFKHRNAVNAVPSTLEWTLTLPTFVQAASHFGYFNAELDDDGTIRRSQLVTRVGSQYLPSIALQAYLAATDNHLEIDIAPHSKIPGLKGITRFQIVNEDGEPQFKIPVNPEGQMHINYAGRRHTIPHVSMADLLDEANPNINIRQQVRNEEGRYQEKEFTKDKKEFLQGKILVAGATAIGVFDLRVTPFDENFPGVETHANVIDNIIRQDFLFRAANEDWWMPAIMLAIGILVSIALSHLGAVSGLVFTTILVAGITLIDKYFLFSKGQLVSIILPIFQIVFSYAFLTFYKYFTEERSKKELRATFSKYVSPAIVEEILKDPKNLELGGRKERVTVFFSDVRGFTTISEKLDPRALSDLLNSYLTPMTDLVFKNQGTLDKYMGDAIMAFFGAPVHYADHAKMACLCALQNLEKLKELQAIYAKKNLPQIDVGIGLNTGECSVGNMGSETVRSYTVMGDAVNLASRLEGINKSYGTHIIISEFTHADVKDDFLCREVDWVRVKGKLKPVKIFELIGEKTISTHLIEMSKYFSEGYLKYHERQFANAIKMFESALVHNPQDETSKIYIERCQEYLLTPPASDWDGVYVMKTK